MSERCPNCDRDDCTRMAVAQAWSAHCGKPNAVTWVDVQRAELDCNAHHVEWRTRCLAAEAERDGLRATLATAQQELDVTRDAWQQAVKAGDLVRARVDAVRECCNDVIDACGRDSQQVSVDMRHVARAVLAALKGE